MDGARRRLRCKGGWGYLRCCLRVMLCGGVNHDRIDAEEVDNVIFRFAWLTAYRAFFCLLSWLVGADFMELASIGSCLSRLELQATNGEHGMPTDDDPVRVRMQGHYCCSDQQYNKLTDVGRKNRAVVVHISHVTGLKHVDCQGMERSMRCTAAACPLSRYRVRLRRGENHNTQHNERAQQAWSALPPIFITPSTHPCLVPCARHPTRSLFPLALALHRRRRPTAAAGVGRRGRGELPRSCCRGLQAPPRRVAPRDQNTCASQRCVAVHAVVVGLGAWWSRGDLCGAVGVMSWGMDARTSAGHRASGSD